MHRNSTTSIFWKIPLVVWIASSLKPVSDLQNIGVPLTPFFEDCIFETMTRNHQKKMSKSVNLKTTKMERINITSRWNYQENAFIWTTPRFISHSLSKNSYQPRDNCRRRHRDDHLRHKANAWDRLRGLLTNWHREGMGKLTRGIKTPSQVLNYWTFWVGRILDGFFYIPKIPSH